MVAAWLAGLVMASSCGAPEVPVQTGTMGTNARVGPVLLRNVFLQAPGDGAFVPGEDGRIRLWLFNESGVDDALVAVRSEVGAGARIRWDRGCDGVLEVVDSLPVRGSGTVPFSPAYVVELLGFDQTVLAGTTVPVTFTFREAGEVTVSVLAEAARDGDVSVPPRCLSAGAAVT